SVAGFQACKQKNKADSHNSKNSLNWDGIYVGTIPCDDCAGIEVIIILGDDNTYSMSYKYLGKENSEDGYANFSGSFAWNKDGNTVIFSDKTRPHYFKVGENTLTQLDKNGKPITGKLAGMYVLTKTESLDDGHNSPH
ncbi:MAG: copper resistance protein NlpE, partial [Tannerella sp.]|nr:copper resistance protein NlpE [Tannerella sp.]